MSLSPGAASRLLSSLDPCQVFGKVTKVVGLIAEGRGLTVPVGSLCHIVEENTAEPIPAEVVGFRDGNLLLMPYDDLRGIQPGSLIRASNLPPVFPVGPHLLGRAFDAFGAPLDAESDTHHQIISEEGQPIYAAPPNPLSRPRIFDPLDVGVRAINALLTLGKGQRVAIMAGSGVGKSTLLGMMARYTKADVNVIALVGERGREVVEFMEKDLGPEGMARSVLVIATSDASPLVRMRAAYAATAVAEYYRDQGKDVLLMMDSVTRFAMAAREVGLSVGEPPTSKGYTPSVFAQLPKLLERAGRSPKGTITGIYTVLVDGDDFNEPIADSVRSILDGHVVLTRELANQAHYPCIDVLKSISRLKSDISSKEDVRDARKLLAMMASYSRMEDMINIGAYVQGSNPEVDKAITMHNPINAFLRQDVDQGCSLEDSLVQMRTLAAQ